MSLPIHGFLLADKPAGISSFGVVGGVRAALGGRLRGPSRLRAGHAGTLDPMATGLLLVLCGAVTRLQPYLVGHDKRYRAVVRLGAGTDSHDRDGEPVGRAAVDCDMDDVTAALAAFRGRIEQRPPRISALKRDGRALYALARRGEAPRQEPRPVLIRRIEAAPLRWGDPAADDPLAADDGRVYEFGLLVECGSGTYVRALARDIAAALGTLGHLRALRREASGDFLVEDALAPDRLRDPEALRAALRPAAAALPGAPVLRVDDAEALLLRRGGQPDPGWITRLEPAPEPGMAGDGSARSPFRILDARGGLVAVGRLVDGEDGAVVPRTAVVMPACEEEA